MVWFAPNLDNFALICGRIDGLFNRGRVFLWGNMSVRKSKFLVFCFCIGLLLLSATGCDGKAFRDPETINVYDLNGIEFHIPEKYMYRIHDQYGYNQSSGKMAGYLTLSVKLPEFIPFEDGNDERDRLIINFNRANFEDGEIVSDDNLLIAYENYQQIIDNYDDYLYEIGPGIYKLKKEAQKNIKEIDEALFLKNSQARTIGLVKPDDIGNFIYLKRNEQRYGRMPCRNNAPRCTSYLTYNRYVEGGYIIPNKYLDDLPEIDRKVGDLIQSFMRLPSDADVD